MEPCVPAFVLPYLIVVVTLWRDFCLVGDAYSLAV